MIPRDLFDKTILSILKFANLPYLSSDIMEVFIANSDPEHLVNRRPVFVGCRLRLNDEQRNHTKVLQRKWMVDGGLVGNSWSEDNIRSKTALLGDTLVHLPLDSEDDDRVTYKCYLYYTFHSQLIVFTGFVKGTFRNHTDRQLSSVARHLDGKVSLYAYPSWSSIPLGFQELTLFCISWRKPDDLIHWFFDGTSLESVSTLEEGKHYISPSVVEGKLRLVNIAHAHAGEWSCKPEASGSSDEDGTLRSGIYQLNVTSSSK